jgi:hypothetical protein
MKMKYKYIIKKIKTDQGIKYYPIFYYKNKWKYLIKPEQTFMVSNRVKSLSDTLYQCYRFVGSHRMTKTTKSKCLFFNEYVSMIPFIGLGYIIDKLINKITLRQLYNNHVVFWTSMTIQFLSLIFLLILL